MVSCPVRLAFQDGEPDFLFEETTLLETMKNALPRFGQPDELQSWMNGEDPTGYAIGAMATSIIVTSVLVLWALLLFLCSRAGPNRVGWLSGKILVTEPPVLSPLPTLEQQQQQPDEAAMTSLLSQTHDHSGQSSSTAKHANNTRGAISPTESLLDDDDPPVEEPPGTSLLSSIMDSTLPSMSTLQSMFIDDEDEDEEDNNNDNLSHATLTLDLGPPLPSSPILSLQPSSSTSTSQPSQQQRKVQVEVEVSALTTPDPDLPVSSANSVASTTSEKYADYLKYLDQAMNRPKLITSPHDTDDDDDSIDSDDMLLADILADDDPTFWSTDLPPPDPIHPVPTESRTAPVEPPSLLRSRPNVLDLSFPDGDQDGFLFEDNAASSQPQEPQQQQPLPPDEPPSRTISPTPNLAPFAPPPMEPDTPTSLPRSNFTSQAASRKRLLESYVENRKRSSPSIFPLLVTDDSTMLNDVEHGLLIRPEPMAKVYDDDDDDDINNNDDTDTDTDDNNDIEDHSADHTNSSKDESISDMVDDLLAHALAPSSDEMDPSPERPRGVGVDLDETQSTMESHLLPPSWNNPHPMDILNSTESQQQQERQVIQREKKETNSTQPTDQSTTSTVSHDDVGGDNNANDNNEPPMSTSQMVKAKTQDEYVHAHDSWLEQRRRSIRRLNRLRIGVVFVATFLVISTLLGALNGAWALNWNRQTMLNAWSNVQSTALELQNNVIELRALQSSIRQQLWNLWQLLDQHCPLVRTSICPLAYLPSGNNVTCNLTGIPLEDSWQRWLGTFVNDDTVAQTLFDPEDWDAFAVDLSTLVDQPIEHSLDGWNWALWAAVACNCLLSVFALSILAAISLDGATRLHYQLSTWSFATVYWVTVLLAWIFGIGFMIGTTLAVDSCTTTVNDIASPAVTAKSLLAKIPTQSPLPQYWDYIVDGCPSDSYPQFLTERVWTWGNTLPGTVRIATRLEEFPDKDFLETCGSPITPLRSAAETLSTQLCMVTQSLVQIRRSLGCDQWYPWYESMANDAICYHGSSAFVWSSACQIVVLVLAFLLWTMRVSFLTLANDTNNPKIVTDKTKPDNNNDNTTPADLEPSIVEDEGEITFL